MYVWHSLYVVCMYATCNCMYVWHSLYVVEQPVCMCGIAYMLWSNLYVCVAEPICCGATCMYVWHSLYVVEQPVCMCGIAYMLWSNLYVCVA